MAAPTPEQVAGGSRERLPGPALARCGIADAGAFGDEVWGRRPDLNRTSGFADLFSAAAVDELVAERGLRTPFLRMAQDGTVVPASEYTGPGGVGARVADQADAADILAQLRGGASLVLQALHRTWAPLADFTRTLSAELGHPVQANAYITPPGAQGFASHYDTHDVFVLQIAGTKAWRIHEPVLAHPLPDQPWDTVRHQVARRAEEPPYLQTEMSPGDSLYLPRGWLHSAVSGATTSIHVTLGIHPVTRADAARAALAQLLRTDSALRANLPLGAGAAADDDALTEVVTAVAAALPQADPAGVRAELSARFAADVPPEPPRPLAQLAAAAELSADSLVRVRPGTHPTVRRHGNRVRLTAGGRFVEAPEAGTAALHLLAVGAPLAAADLPDLPARTALALVRRALGEGIVVPA